MIKDSTRNFNNKKVGVILDNNNSSKWYLAANIINILVKTNSPKQYWNRLKMKNPKLSPFSKKMKIYKDNEKKHLSDVINKNGLKKASNYFTF